MSVHETITTSVWEFAVWRGASMVDFRRAHNILTNVGLREMALRNTGGTTSINSHMAVGTRAVAESPADGRMPQEIARLPMATAAVNGTTERYTCAFGGRANLGNVVRQIAEAGIFTQAAPGGVLVHRVATAPIEIRPDDTLTIATTVGHRNGAV